MTDRPQQFLHQARNRLLQYYCSYQVNALGQSLYIFSSVGTPAIPAATIEFASLCLRNAQLLLPEDSPTAEVLQSEDQDGG